MEQDRETKKLINVLRRIADVERYTMWRGEDEGLTKFCVTQYNKILARLMEYDPTLQPLFTPLPENTSSKTIRFAARELVAYLAEEMPDEAHFRPHQRRHGCCGARRARGAWSAVNVRFC